MKPTKVARPKFPPGYEDNPIYELPWDYVARQLTDSKHYWMCSVRPNGSPHCGPRWAVYKDGLIY